ncbi:aromatic amino acid lyase [Streptomyces sp. NPDC058464]|uniref:aromatic amino acid lyase n=1 Tax=Streptomyces sp. NPDC058464 TaxID=3346511 RepID=UPI0036592F7A
MDRVMLDGNGLGLTGLVRLADAVAGPVVPPGALHRVRRAHESAGRLAAQGQWYGRGTGVGAHRSVAVDPSDAAGHALRLLRSHAGGAGPVLPARQARALMAVRANQLLAAGSGIHPSFVTALTEALRLGVHPVINEYGGVGTGDLTALAQTGLTLIGERPWLTASPDAELPAPVALRPGDSLALLSSNALAVGRAALACHDLEEAASFAGQAAKQAERAAEAYRVVLACELVAAVRALRLGPVEPSAPAFRVAAAALPADMEDRALTGDVTTAMELLPQLADL